MAKKKYIQIPRGYISYSQIQLWKQNKNRYKELYFNNRTELSVYNESMEYGKQFADALENYEETGDILTDASILLLKKYDVRDQEIKIEFKTPHGWLTLLGRPDTLNSKTYEFREYKTGKRAWTQGAVDKHYQLFFYAVIIYLKYGKALPDCYLDWIETESVEIDGKQTIQPTGKILSFKTTIGLQKILETMAEVTKVAQEIELAYASHITIKDEF